MISMKVKDGFILRKIMNEYLLMPAGERQDTFHGVILLNEVSAFIYRKLQSSLSPEELLNAILSEYRVDPEEAARDMNEFLEALDARGLLDRTSYTRERN